MSEGSDDKPVGPPLSAGEAEELTARIAELTSAGMPLVDGLRAAASESSSRRLARVLRGIADAMQSGASLDNALAASRRRLPRYASGLIAAALRTGEFGTVLSELVEQQRAQRERWRTVWSALTYPFLVVCLALIIFAFFEVFIVPEFRSIFEDFELQLPATTQLLLWLGETGIWIGLGVGVIGLVLLLICRLISGRARWYRIKATVPVFGPMWHWSGVADGARMLAALVSQRVPLGQALRLASDGLRDGNVADVFLQMANGVDHGRRISELLHRLHRLPATLTPLVRWGEQNNALPEALRTAAEMFDQRVHFRAALLRSIVPPLLLILVGSFIWFLITSMMLPLISLINALSMNPGPPPAMDTVSPANLLGLMILGVALLWAVHLIYGRNGRVSQDFLKRVLTTAGWLLIMIGLFALLGAASIFGIPAIIVVAVILLISIVKYRAMEQRAFVTVLAVAAERGIPLPRVARAYAAERTDEIGLRAARLADLLDSGMSLADALRQSKSRAPKDVQVAAAVGTTLGVLGPALRQAAEHDDRLEVTLRGVFEKFLYLFAIALFATTIIMFLMIVIVPTFDKMFQDFGLELPQPTLLLISVSRTFAETWYATVPAYLTLPLLLFVCLGYYLGILPRSLPPAGWLTLRIDGALVMRSLALAVRENRTISHTITLLADCYPQYNVRSRLRAAAARINQGMSWQDSLLQSRLIRPADAAVLHSAERVGNLPWALEEMADSIMRRLVYRLTAVVNVVFPTLLFCLGLCVCIIVVALFVPLISLITQLV